VVECHPESIENVIVVV